MIGASSYYLAHENLFLAPLETCPLCLLWFVVIYFYNPPPTKASSSTFFPKFVFSPVAPTCYVVPIGYMVTPYKDTPSSITSLRVKVWARLHAVKWLQDTKSSSAKLRNPIGTLRYVVPNDYMETHGYKTLHKLWSARIHSIWLRPFKD